ncbi:hypothetical protein FOA43_003966 [Brettanomyces nanus]|uniref:Glycoside hydrolase family 5 domain-containing protein n=1 Tax=Eeniella nana TaxID=13502 RepID=A0A875S8Q9_EENNA|nr:uncharacterized protein FOA43_003966 [Brettanomyces nanus]QPG76575.1 hypothetical protein FOA43_003966 [Brettanomyces nanus]
MFDHLKMKLGAQSVITAESAADVGAKPSIKSIYQSRQNFGVNFGSLFVLEKYIFGELFIDDTSVELDAISRCVKKNGLDRTRKEMEDHWNNYCNDDDWKWLQSKGVQSIRIPVGYWGVGGGRFTQGTSFESISAVYQNAWSILIRKYIKKAADYHISILVDLHALEKGANTGDHSGQKFNQPGFWNSTKSISHTCGILSFMASELGQFDNISGLQIVNEASFDSEGKYQKRYYAHAINEIRKVNSKIPIVISDGWWAQDYAKWVNDNGGGALGVVIDDHVYRCFSDDDRSKSAEQLIQELDRTVFSDNVCEEADFIVGEYSCVLDGQTWSKTQGSRDAKVKEYGNKQVQLFRQRARAGYYFWCYKFQSGDGGEWGFRPMVDRGSIPVRNSSGNIPSEDDYNKMLNELYQQHEQYWNRQNPNEHYEHWRYKEGFTTGWADSMEFAKFDNSRIGRVVAWKDARRKEHTLARGESRFIWEWDQGFQKALDIFAGWE